MERDKVKCSDCDKWFRDRYNSYRHYVRIHLVGDKRKTKHKSSTDRTKPSCPSCGHVFYKNGNLKRHLNLCQKKLQPPASEKYLFINSNKFEEWKTKIESETNARFVRKSHYKLQNGASRIKYICHRSGYFKPTGKNVRRRKSIGSNKIDGICPSKMITLVSPDGGIQVLFFPNHEGHDMELKKITLSKVERSFIAEQIANHIPFKEILRNMKNLSDPQFERLRLLTKKDLHNIKKEFSLLSNIPYSFEEVAVEYCVNNNQTCNAAESVVTKSPTVEFNFQNIVSEALAPCQDKVTVPLSLSKPHEVNFYQPLGDINSSNVNNSDCRNDSDSISLGADNVLENGQSKVNSTACTVSTVVNKPERLMGNDGVQSTEPMPPTDLLTTFPLTFDENRQVIISSTQQNNQSLCYNTMPQMSSAEASSPLVEASQCLVDRGTDISESLNRVEFLKNELRKEFEKVLSSIKTVQHVEQGFKWLNSFHTFVQ